MKVLLIAPYFERVIDSAVVVPRGDFIPSAALLHLAAVLRANDCEPILLDLNNSEVDKHKDKYLDYCNKIIIDTLNETKPDLVGINCLFSGAFPDVLKFAKTVKSHSPHLKIAIGGIHPTTYPKEILTHCKEEIDYIAIGEGENTIVSLVKALKEKNENLLSSIKSFAFRDSDGQVKINREANYVEDLDTLPLPAWDLVDFKKFGMNLDHYYNPKNLPLKYMAAVFTSRACPLSCNFCDLFMVMGKKHRKRGVKAIVDEIEYLNKSHEVNYFSFRDDQLTLNRGLIMGICDEIIKRKLNIMFDAANGLWINSLREDVIAKMAEAGFVYANLAIEHGDDYMRNEIIQKVLDRKKIFEVVALFKKYKIMSTGMFIMGFPEDTNETLQNTYDMIEELQMDKATVCTLIPFPGTKLFKQVVKDKLFIKETNYDELWKLPQSLVQRDFVIKPYNMSIDDLYKWREKFSTMRTKYWKTNPIKAPLFQSAAPGLTMPAKIL